MSYYVYLIECNDGTFYIGKTSDLKKRVQKHNGRLPGGAKYTRSRGPVQLRYYEQYFTNSDALKREYTLKQLLRKQKSHLVEEFNVCFLENNG